MISGYQGSPLGGFDKELAAGRASCSPSSRSTTSPRSTRSSAPRRCGARSSPPRLPSATVDGVVGWWYGKAPGRRPRRRRAAPRQLRRRRARRAAWSPSPATTPPRSPPPCPSATRGDARRRSACPILYPGSRPGDARPRPPRRRRSSRASGLWTRAEGRHRASPTPPAPPTSACDRVRPVLPMVEFDGGPYVHQPDASLLAPASVEMERTLHGPRLELAREYAPRQPPQPRRRSTRRTRSSASSPPARPTTTCARRCARSASTDGVRILHARRCCGRSRTRDRARLRPRPRRRDRARGEGPVPRDRWSARRSTTSPSARASTPASTPCSSRTRSPASSARTSASASRVRERARRTSSASHRRRSTARRRARRSSARAARTTARRTRRTTRASASASAATRWC